MTMLNYLMPQVRELMDRKMIPLNIARSIGVGVAEVEAIIKIIKNQIQKSKVSMNLFEKF